MRLQKGIKKWMKLEILHQILSSFRRFLLWNFLSFRLALKIYDKLIHFAMP